MSGEKSEDLRQLAFRVAKDGLRMRRRDFIQIVEVCADHGKEG